MQAGIMDPYKQRFSYKTMKPYTLPKLSDLQLGALAAVRDDEVEPYELRVGYDRYQAYRSHGFDVTCQIQSLRKRRLIRSKSDGSKRPVLTPHGAGILSEHPEY